MKALSIRQPWASLIVHGFKPVENRTWQTDVRGRVLIHAAKKDDDAGYAMMVGRGISIPVMPLGAIIGVADIVDCVTAMDSDWFFGPYGFVMRNPRLLRPVQYRGQLGFFDVPDDVVALLGLEERKAA